MERINKKKLFGDTLLYSLGEIIPRVISFLLLPILTRYLSTSDYGITSYTNTVMTFMFVIASLSLNTFLLRNYYTEKSDIERRKLIGSVFVFIFVLNIVLLLLQFLFFPKIIESFNINVPFKPFFFLAIVNNFFDVISIIPLVLYRVKENAKGFIILSLSRVVLQFFLTYILVVVLRQGLTGSYLAKLYVNIPFGLIYIYVIYLHGTFSLDLKKIKDALAFSIPFLPASLSYLVISTSDRIILERYISLDKVGIYSVAFTLTLTLNIVTQALYKTFQQVVFKNVNELGFGQLNNELYSIFSFVVALVGLCLALFSPEIFTIAAEKSFFSGHLLVPFMTITVVISAFNMYLNTLLIAKSQEKIVSILNVASAIVSVSLNFYLVPKFGFYGAIISSIISVSIISIGGYLKLRFGNIKIIAFQLFSLGVICWLSVWLNQYLLLTPSILLNLLIKVFVIAVFCVIGLNFLQINIVGKFIGSLKNKMIKGWKA